MKKLCMMLAVAACAIGAFAALDTRVASADVAFPAQSVTAGAAVTNAVMAVEPCRGLGEISFAIGSVAAASSNRTITATLIGTNTVAGGWSVINTATYKGCRCGGAAYARTVRLPAALHQGGRGQHHGGLGRGWHLVLVQVKEPAP